MPQIIKPGDDITHLINGVNEGDDVTSLMNSSTASDEKPSTFKKLTKGGLLDSSIPLTKRLSNLAFGPETTPEGYKIIDGRTEKSLLPDIKQPETYTGGFARSLYDDYVKPLATPSGFLGLMQPKPIPQINPTALQASIDATKAARTTAGLDASRLALPAVGESSPGSPRTFFQGPAGVTQSDKLYPMDTAPQSPRLGQQGAGTILPRETEGLSNLDPITAANRGTKMGDIRSLDKETPQGTISSLRKLTEGEPMKMPTDNAIGDISGDKGNIGDPTLPYQTESAPKQSKFKPQTFVPDTPDSPVGKTTTEPKSIDVAKNDSNAVPSPGQAVTPAANPKVQNLNKSPRSKDIGAFQAEFGSVDKTLSSRPETAPIAQAIIGAADQKAKWIATTERQLADVTKGLGKGDLVSLGDIVDKGAKPGDNPELVQRALAIRQVLDSIHQDLKIPTSAGGKMGYIENYLTHISKLPEDDLKSGIKQIWEYHVGKPFNDLFSRNELAKPGESVNDLYDRGLGNPDSPFRKPRGNGENDIELNVNKVLPAYVESIARLKFDRLAVDTAKQALMSVPDKDIYGNPSKIKELAGWYIKNYTRYDSMPGLTKGWNDLTSMLMRTTSNSMLGFSTGLQTLHLARIPANLYPELGEKYLAKGAAMVAKNPVKAYTEAASLGLLQNEVRPFAFKTPMERVQSISSFMSAADFLDKSIGYHGFKMRFMDEGMGEAEASAAALDKAKSASLTSDTARPIKSFNPPGTPAGMAWKLGTQFKQAPARIIEQYLGIMANMKQDPVKAARMVAGVGLTAAIADAGLHTFHISPKQFAMQTGGAVGSVMLSVYKDLAKGDIYSALKKTVLWITPGGMSIERQMRRGLSAFEDSNQPAPFRP